MSLFDNVHFVTTCPKCGAPLGGFQSKDGACNLDTVEPDTVRQFYSSCRACSEWVEYSRDDLPDTPLRPEPLTEQEVLALGFVKTHYPLPLPPVKS
jgi:hypothetical protein